MNLKIIMPYYPIKRLDNISAVNVFQGENFNWRYSDKEGTIYDTPVKEDFLLRGLEALRKNSFFKHEIIICTEDNVSFNKKYFEYLKNIFIHK